MEKIRKIDVGTLLLSDSNSEFEDGIRKRSYIKFKNGGHFDDSSHLIELSGKRCYVVSKKDLDALEARNATLEEMNCTPVWDENQKLKKRVKELEGQLADQKKKYDKKMGEAFMETNAALYNCAYRLIAIDKEIEDLKNQTEQIEELEKDRDYWKDRFGSVMTDVSNTLAANGVEFTVKAIDGNKWNVIIDIPELKEMKNKVEELQKRGDYWKGESDAMTRNYHNLEKSQEKRWSAMLQALKEKGVEVLYMGEEDGKPNIDVKIPAIGDLKKELDDLKSKTVAEARYVFEPECLTLIFTMCDGSEQIFGMDSSEAIDATSISCGTVPKCSSCSHFMHSPSRFAHDWCYMPIPKEGGAGYIRKLNKEEAEGPACDKFEAKKEADCKDCKHCKHYKKALWKVSIDGEGVDVCTSPNTRYCFCRNNCNGEKACPEFEKKEE